MGDADVIMVGFRCAGAPLALALHRAVDRIVTDDAREHFLAIYLDGRNREIRRRLALRGKAGGDLQVKVLSGQSRSGAEARTESCGRRGNAGSEA